MGKPEITREQAEKIAQVAATMAVEDMPLTEQAYKNLIEIASGRKTAAEIAAEITARYKNNR